MADLLVDRHGHTTVFTINRPERMNSLGGTVMADLDAGLAEFRQDPDQHVAVITGTGDKAFSAGADLKEMAARAEGGTAVPVSRQPDIAGLAACEKVTIAAVNGLAVAAGLEISISCDIRVASHNAWFGAFEVERGFLAGVAVNVLPRLLPIGTVMDMMLTGGRLSAEEAHRLGFVQQLVPREELLDAALKKAEAVSRQSQVAVWGTKQVIKFWRDAMMAEQQRYYEAWPTASCSRATCWRGRVRSRRSASRSSATSGPACTTSAEPGPYRRRGVTEGAAPTAPPPQFRSGDPAQSSRTRQSPSTAVTPVGPTISGLMSIDSIQSRPPAASREAATSVATRDRRSQAGAPR
ncbi:hypothetical protein CJD44_00950 [Streptomyces sp. alain-838]|nr:hypothetical protein CJD44_00950 [Streptomyces sp. alain-838]